MSLPRIATVSLAGCFGCHSSLLDLDEHLLELARRVEFDRAPFTDVKTLGDCDIGLVEGGVCNADNVELAREFRRRCRILVALGACASTGGVPAQRNPIPVQELLASVYRVRPGAGQTIPGGADLPLPLDKVYPLHEVVRVDLTLPGCPPPADDIRRLLESLLEGRVPALPVHPRYD